VKHVATTLTEMSGQIANEDLAGVPGSESILRESQGLGGLNRFVRANGPRVREPRTRPGF
jgi:hypothetical protein